MAITVEDGTGKSDADAYISVADVDAFHLARGRTDWAAGSSANKETSIVRATDYLDQRFGTKFRGEKTTGDQALEWPRVNAFDNSDHVLTGVPVLLERACSEYALVALRQAELAPPPLLPVPSMALDGTQGTATATGEITKKKVGPIEKEYRATSEAYQSSQSQRSQQSSLVSDFHIPEYPAADLWVQELIRSNTSFTLVRA